jgi:hypothetical protein
MKYTIIFKNSVPTSKKTQSVSITKINWLMLSKEISSQQSVRLSVRPTQFLPNGRVVEKYGKETMLLLERQLRKNYTLFSISKIRNRGIQKLIQRCISPKRRVAEKKL